MIAEIDKIRNLSVSELSVLIRECSSKRAVLEKLGIAKNNSHALKYLISFIEHNGIDISHHTLGNPYSARFSKQFVLNAVGTARTWTELLSNFGLNIRGNNIRTIKRVLKYYNINFSPIVALSNKRPSPNEIFCEHSKVSGSTLRRRFFEHKDKIACAECGLGDVWNSKPLKLQIDHINGIPNDNRLTNLRLLCPNCHTQTVTFGAGNIKNLKMLDKPHFHVIQ